MTLFYDIVEFGLPLGRVIAKINAQIKVALPVGRFVACACLCIDAKNGASEIWMGGMPSAIMIDATGRKVNEIASTHLPLGIDDFDWRKSAVEMLNVPPGGGQIVLYSDGLVEAINAAGEAFGMERLCAALVGVPPSVWSRQDAVAGMGEPAARRCDLMLVDCHPQGR
jgi:serine phosphatase RsbU (regulator of sigma subunit)